jgi:polar amino acid transport system substrate-binding protein
MRRTLTVTGLALASLLFGACTSGATPSPSPIAASVAPSATAAASIAASPSADPCAKDSLTLTTAGKLTVGTDNPAYPPYYASNPAGNTAPWDKDQGDPTTGEGFESAVA